jgi:hypothetical protein
MNPWRSFRNLALWKQVIAWVVAPGCPAAIRTQQPRKDKDEPCGTTASQIQMLLLLI